MESAVYTHNNVNLVGIAAFNRYAALCCFSRDNIDDCYHLLIHLLINAQPAKTKTMRQQSVTQDDIVNRQQVSHYI